MSIRGLRLLAADPAAGDPPSRLRVIPWGRTETREGPIVFEQRQADAVLARLKQQRRDKIPLTFDHPPKAETGPKLRAGYGTPEVVPGDGMYLTAIRWTEAGRKHWDSYEDLSPGIRVSNKTGEVTFLDHVALCEHGELEGVTMFSVATDGGMPPVRDASYLPLEGDDMKQLLIKLLGKAGSPVADDATTDDILAAAEKVFGTAPDQPNPPTETEAQMSADEITKAVTAAVTAAVDPLTKRLEEQEKLLSATQAAQTAAEKRSIIDAATAAGKVVPFSDEEVREFSAGALRKLCDALPAGEVPTKKGKDGGKEPDAGERAVEFSAEQLAIFASAGVTEEEVRKFTAGKVDTVQA